MIKGLIQKLFFLLCIFNILHAQAPQQIEVSADRIITDQIEGKSLISGHVQIQRGQDQLFSDEVIFYFDTQTRKPTQYEAYGNVIFQVMLDDGRMIAGKANQAIFAVNSDTYELIGDAFVQEVGTNNQVHGDSISVSRKNGFVNVEGGQKKPAKVIFLYDTQQKAMIDANKPAVNENPQTIDQTLKEQNIHDSSD